jgi:hypothetical protein
MLLLTAAALTAFVNVIAVITAAAALASAVPGEALALVAVPSCITIAAWWLGRDERRLRAAERTTWVMFALCGLAACLRWIVFVRLATQGVPLERALTDTAHYSDAAGLAFFMAVAASGAWHAALVTQPFPEAGCPRDTAR